MVAVGAVNAPGSIDGMVPLNGMIFAMQPPYAAKLLTWTQESLT
jgi:hypothetical protein